MSMTLTVCSILFFFNVPILSHFCASPSNRKMSFRTVFIKLAPAPVPPVQNINCEIRKLLSRIQHIILFNVQPTHL